MRLINTNFFRLLLIASTFSTSIFAQTAAQPSPTPSTDSSALTSRQTVQTLAARIADRLARPEVRRGQIGVKVASLSTGKVLFQQNAEKYFMPASNMKNFTVATALEKLTPDYKLVTTVYSTAP